MKLAADIERRLAGLEARHREVVEATLNAVAQRLVLTEGVELARTAMAGRATADVAGILMHGRGEEVARVAGLLASVQGDQQDLAAWGRLQATALYRSIEENSFTAAELQALGVSEGTLAPLCEEDCLLGIRLPFQQNLVYPRWQFEQDSLRPKQYLRGILSAAREAGLDPISLHTLMTNPAAGDRPGETLVSACDRGEVGFAVNAIRASGELGG